MTPLRRLRSVSAKIGRLFVGFIVLVLLVIGAGLTVLETGWAKNRIRDLIVRQANQYLTATLAIDYAIGGGDVAVFHLDSFCWFLLECLLLAALPLTRRLDGLVVMGLPLDESVAARLVSLQLPTVLVDLRHPSFDSVHADDPAGTESGEPVA